MEECLFSVSEMDHFVQNCPLYRDKIQPTISLIQSIVS